MHGRSAKRFLACALLLAAFSGVGIPACHPATFPPKHGGQEGLPRQNVRQGASRDREQKPDEIIAALGIKPGDHVADVGAGAGYMLPFLSRAVSPGGLVYEQDISSEALGRAKERAARLKIENVRFILGDAKDPHLPKGEIDSVLVLDAYHHFEFAQEMLEQIRTALKPGGRLAIVDFFKRGGMANHVRLDRDEVIKQVESFGWKLEASPDFLTNQYILILTAAEKPETAGMLLRPRLNFLVPQRPSGATIEAKLRRPE